MLSIQWFFLANNCSSLIYIKGFHSSSGQNCDALIQGDCRREWEIKKEKAQFNQFLLELPAISECLSQTRVLTLAQQAFPLLNYLPNTKPWANNKILINF